MRGGISGGIKAQIKPLIEQLKQLREIDRKRGKQPAEGR
jgi:hypothetical protein